jgi:hypothetical protein
MGEHSFGADIFEDLTPPNRMRTHWIEALESRIAPAAISVTYTDIDGDLVKITASKPGPAAPPLDKVSDTSFVGGGTDGQLANLILTDPGFEGASIVFTVTKKPGGDGLAHVGLINAANVDLNRVVVKGDLGKIVVGDADLASPGLGILRVRSLGAYGLATQGGSGDLFSAISGKALALKVTGDVRGAAFQASEIGAITIGGSLDGGNIFSSSAIGPVKIGHDIIGSAVGNFGFIQAVGKLESVTVGGSVRGGPGEYTGAIRGAEVGPVKIRGDVIGGSGLNSGSIITTGGDIGRVSIGGSLTGGAGEHSGVIEAFLGALASTTIGGSLIGGAGQSTGRIEGSHDVGAVKIGQDVRGGTGNFSGQIVSDLGELASVTIGGSFIGGSPVAGFLQSTGVIQSFSTMGPVKIGHDFIGGSVSGSATLRFSGMISNLYGQMVSIVIGGSIISGIDTSSGTLTESAVIRCGTFLGSLTVKGSLLGNHFGDLSPVNISANGQETPTATVDVAIGKVTIGGRIELARILGGFNGAGNPVNGNAQIGAVRVGGDWIASTLAAGIENYGANGIDEDGFGDDNVNFGDANDHVINNVANSIARIASIRIKGLVSGSATAGDHFGFVSHQIGSFKSLGFTAPLSPSTDTAIALSLVTGDVTIQEV